MCQESSQNYLFFFKLSTLHDSNTLDHWLGIKQLHLKCYDKRKNGSLSRRLYCVMNGHHDVAEPLVSAAFSPHLELFLFSLLSPSHALFFEATCLALCPNATCHQRAIQPQAHTADPGRCPRMDTGVEGARGQSRQSDTTDRRRKKKNWKKPLALAIMFWLTWRKCVRVCVCVTSNVYILSASVCYQSQQHLLLFRSLL